MIHLYSPVEVLNTHMYTYIHTYILAEILIYSG